jgi:hypothetical protein
LLKFLVNTAVAGNVDFTYGGNNYPASETVLNADVLLKKSASASLNVTVHGILNLNGTGTYMLGDGSKYTGELARYFLGSGKTSNVGGVAMAVNFIDITPNPFLPFYDATFKYTDAQMISKQYLLMQHLYQIFSKLLGCSLGYPTYGGEAGMWSKHRFMALTNAQNMYFITQVGAAAASYGVTKEDIGLVAGALINVFNRKDAPAYAIAPAAGLTSALQSCCQGPTCIVSPNPNPATGGAPTPLAYITAANPVFINLILNFK